MASQADAAVAVEVLIFRQDHGATEHRRDPGQGETRSIRPVVTAPGAQPRPSLLDEGGGRGTRSARVATFGSVARKSANLRRHDTEEGSELTASPSAQAPSIASSGRAPPSLLDPKAGRPARPRRLGQCGLRQRPAEIPPPLPR